MKKHINKFFDIDLAQTLGLAPGKQRISVQFIIDQNGNVVDIISRANHLKLEKEAKRIIKKLPKMIPGKQNNKKVRVKYNLPINFNVED
jgi:protein TonB